jgi:GNAT superfamily N-acetyltransferase
MARSQPVQIRPATQEDVPLLLTLIRALAEYEKLSHMVSASEPLLREHLFGQKRAAEALIASLDGKAVGFALFFSTFSTFLGLPGIWLEDVFVLPEARGRGVGKAILKRMAAIARERGCGRLEWSALDWNEPAIRFYEKLGATRMEEWRIFRLTGEALAKVAESGETP